MTRLAWVFLAFWIAGLCDYAVQAAWWGWPIPIDMLARGPKWVWYLDWIHHDPWHVWQTLRNALWLFGAWSVCKSHESWYVSIPVMLSLYALSRGASSSVLMHFRTVESVRFPNELTLVGLLLAFTIVVTFVHFLRKRIGW